MSPRGRFFAVVRRPRRSGLVSHLNFGTPGMLDETS
jgi:hypothetical protein